MKHDISKYIISLLLFVFGAVAVYSYAVGKSGDGLESQPLAMLFAGLSLIAVAAIALPEVLVKLDSKKYKGLLFGGVAIALGLGYSVYYSVAEEMEFQATKQSIDAATIQQLKDIRDIQLAFKSVSSGGYAADFDTLAQWVKLDVLPVTFNMGSFHDTLPESKSVELGYIIKIADIDSIATTNEMSPDSLRALIEEDMSPYKVRDTLYTNYFDENLTKEARESAKLPEFDLEALPFNALTNERFIMKTSAVEIGGVWQATILVQDPTPFGRENVKKDTLRFGSLTEAHTDGNWRN